MAMTTSVHESAHLIRRPGPTAGDVRIADLSNDSVIIRLHFAVNHLSRWLTPIHDLERLDRVVYRDQPSIKELVIQMREEERRVFPMLYLMASENNPDLDRSPATVISPEQEILDRNLSVLTVMSEFRRLRQSTCSLLRSLTDAGWLRVGTSRKVHDWQIRSLAEQLIAHDETVLTQIDLALDRYGLRDGVAEHGRAHFFELLKIIPVTVRKSS
jgi:hypothetical protein